MASEDGRVVTVSSMFHNFAGKPPLGDPREQHGRYSKWRVYGQSRLANLYFTAESGPPPARARPAGAGAGRAPGLRGHPPGGERAVRPLLRRDRLDPRRRCAGGLAVRGRGRPAVAVGRDRRPARQHLRGPERLPADVGRPAPGRPQQAGPGRAGGADPVGDQRGDRGPALPLT
ncbi:hypothetical protein [Nocardioides convexus]|uniref:hypothetical protein n=1 Tax=Nocardioides convexus TaxID=2712224 RepID=UPI0024185155|nr:hypothetical protein [Nocardioides convexus]